MSGQWYRDQGIARYQAAVYEVQLITFITPGATASLKLPTYLNLLTPSALLPDVGITITATTKLADVQKAIETLPNVDSVSVFRYYNTAGEIEYSVTFLSNLGQVPLMVSAVPSDVLVTEATAGITEIQVITLASDIEYIREVQSFTATAGNDLTVSYNTQTTAQIASPTAAKLQAAINLLVDASGTQLNVAVASTVAGIYTVTFLAGGPVGDIVTLKVLDITTPASLITVTETTKGVSPSTGTFTLLYEGQYTSDIPSDASALEVQTAIQALDNVGNVVVARTDLNNGLSWTVQFTQNGGDLRLMAASPSRYEVQRVSTTGGSPTPLSGQFALSFGGDTVTVNYDASASSLQSSLESMPSVGNVEVSLQASSNGQRTWLVTFRSLIANLDTLSYDTSLLLGSNADTKIVEVVAGNNKTLSGSNPRISVAEQFAGLPSYLGSYTVDLPGNYLTKVSQLTMGGLSAKYFDNQYLYGSPSLERIDTTVDFNFGLGLITMDASEYVSIRWSGKLLAPKTEAYTLYLTADDAANLAVNHTMVINASDVCCIEHRAVVNLVADQYIDLILEYQQLTGAASVTLMWSSASVRKQIIPSSALFHSTDIKGSPYTTTVVPGAADFPFTDAFGDGLTNAIAGNIATFFIQTKDALGNNKTLDYENVDPNDLLSVQLTLIDATVGKIGYYAFLEYAGPGLFKASYTPLKSGMYALTVEMGGYNIYCGRGEANKCSPFALNVSPGPTVPIMSEAESPADEKMDYLVEAVAGQFGFFYIQAKDTYGNNQNIGGDPFIVKFTETSNSIFQYQATVDDHGDGTYTARYTIPTAGAYKVLITLLSSNGLDESLLSCVAASNPFVFNRVYNGITAYNAPVFCKLNQALSLTVVHNDLDAASCTYDETSALTLSFATVGVENTFKIDARDSFDNLRIGARTTHFVGYGDGVSDYFLAEFEQAETGDKVVVSSAIDYIVATLIDNTLPQEYFRLSFGGRTTSDIISGVSAGGLEAILESLFDYQLNVNVVKTRVAATAFSTTTTWAVQFLTMLDVWQSKPDFGPATTGHLTLVKPSSTAATLTFFNAMAISRQSTKGIYPVSFSLWHTGSYFVRITNKGVDIQGSPLTISVKNGTLDAQASLAFGSGLVGGVAGTARTVNIQAKDTRRTAVQYLISSAEISPYVQEIQSVTLKTGFSPFSIVFRGQTSKVLSSTSTFTDLTNALTGLNVMGNFTLLDTSGVVVTNFASTLASFQIKFTSLVGSLPLISSIDSTSATTNTVVSKIMKGDAPYRHEVQTITCKTGALTGYVSFSMTGIIGLSTTNFIAQDTIVSLVAQLGKFGYGAVTVTGYSSLPTTASTGSSAVTTLCQGSGKTVLYISFDNSKGDVPLLVSSSLAMAVSSADTSGALGILFPLWGSFSIGINDEKTPDLNFDAGAEDIRDALKKFHSLDDVTVLKDGYVVPYNQDAITPFFPMATTYSFHYAFSIWTIEFRTSCSDSTGIFYLF